MPAHVNERYPLREPEILRDAFVQGPGFFFLQAGREVQPIYKRALYDVTAAGALTSDDPVLIVPVQRAFFLTNLLIYPATTAAGQLTFVDNPLEFVNRVEIDVDLGGRRALASMGHQGTAVGATPLALTRLFDMFRLYASPNLYAVGPAQVSIVGQVVTAPTVATRAYVEFAGFLVPARDVSLA